LFPVERAKEFDEVAARKAIGLLKSKQVARMKLSVVYLLSLLRISKGICYFNKRNLESFGIHADVKE